MALDWDALARSAAQGTIVYVTLIGLLKLTGNRTLSKLNAFDLVVTIALGSVLASAFVDGSIGWSRAGMALVVLVLLQFTVAWLEVRSRGFHQAVSTRPTLLFGPGGFREEAMRGARITREDVRTVVRQAGIGGMEDVAAVVLESDGKLAVIPTAGLGSGSALVDVLGPAGGDPPPR